MQNQDIKNDRIDNLYRLVEIEIRNLEKIKSLLKNLDKDEQKDLYRDVPGLVGVYNGTFMVTEDGQNLEVPANYAAKSRLVCGDTLKLIEEDGSKIFKQITKVERKKVEGILTKKEGKWYIISDSGTFKVSDVAADFQHAELNDEAVAFIPAQNTNVLFAALDKVIKKQHDALITTMATTKPVVVPVPAKPVQNPKPISSAVTPAQPASTTPLTPQPRTVSPQKTKDPAKPRTAKKPLGGVPMEQRPVIKPPQPSRPPVDNSNKAKKPAIAGSAVSAAAPKADDASSTATTKTIRLDEDDLR